VNRFWLECFLSANSYSISSIEVVEASSFINCGVYFVRTQLLAFKFFRRFSISPVLSTDWSEYMIDSLLQLIDVEHVLLLNFNYFVNLLFHQFKMICHQVFGLQQRLHSLDLLNLPFLMLVYLLLFNRTFKDVW